MSTPSMPVPWLGSIVNGRISTTRDSRPYVVFELFHVSITSLKHQRSRTQVRTHKQLMRFVEESFDRGSDSNMFTLSVECASPDSPIVRRGALRWFSAPLSKSKRKKPLSTIKHNTQQTQQSTNIERWDCQGLHRALMEISQHLSVVLCLPVTTYKSSVGALMWTEHVRRQRKSLHSQQDHPHHLSEILVTPKVLSTILAEAHRLWTELQVHVKTLHELRDLNIHTFVDGCKYESRAQRVIERCSQGTRDVNRLLKCLVTGKRWAAGERLHLGYRHASDLAKRMLGKVQRLSMESSSDNTVVSSSDVSFVSASPRRQDHKINEEEIMLTPVKKIEESPASSPVPVKSRETWETLVLKGLRDAIRSKRMLFGESLANDTGDLSCVFNAFDRNGDGRISSSELVDGLCRLDIAVSSVQASEVFEHADTDGDGHISYVEFLRMLRVEHIVQMDCDSDDTSEQTEKDEEEQTTRFDILEQETERTCGVVELTLLVFEFSRIMSQEKITRTIDTGIIHITRKNDSNT